MTVVRMLNNDIEIPLGPLTPQDMICEDSLSVVLPVYNEEDIIEDNVLKLRDYLWKNFGNRWEIVIADNLSSDNTPLIGKRLAQTYSDVKYVRVDRKGVGIALKTAWDNSTSDIQCHIDADLPFDLDDLKLIIENVQNGSDLCFGSRYIDGSSTDVKQFRTLFSKLFRLYVKLLFSYEYSDTCGIKAIRREAFSKLSDHMTSDGWFFNTEIRLLANRAKMLITEIPVHVHEPPGRKSKVQLFRTITNLFMLTFRLKIKLLINGSTPVSHSK